MNRTPLRTLGVAALAALLTLAAGPAAAEERYLDFVHKLHERGYGEIAVQYLERLESDSDLPDEVRLVLELELGKSLRISADEAPNADQAQKRLADAQMHLDKFLKENPDHESTADALGALGDIATQRGQAYLRLARAIADASKQTDLFGNARSAFEDARPRFTQSVDRYQSRLRELLATPSQPAKKDTPKKSAVAKVTPKKTRPPANRAERETAAERQDTEMLWLDARFKLALLDYYIAQTFGNANDAARKKALEQAGKGLDGIYQQYRTTEVGLYAHMWHGKTLDELGDVRTALDIYEEVLVSEPEGVHAQTGLEPLFAQVELFKLLLLVKKGDTTTFVTEATEWLRRNQSSRRTSGFQGIALELAKAQIAQAEKSSAEDRRRLFTLALRSLQDIAKVPSDAQQEAILLRRKYQEEARGEAGEIAAFDEGITVGNAAARGGQWNEAVAAYAKAVELGGKEKDPQRVVDARYRLAHALFMAGKVAECAKLAEDIARKDVTSPTAPQAAALATQASLSLYASAQDKVAALDSFMKLANYTIDRWPERPEADDARIALGQSLIVRGDLDAAITVFEQVQPQSDRFAQALHYAGQTHWRGYLAEKQKPDASRNSESLVKHRAEAEKRIGDSLELQQKQHKEGGPIARQLLDTQLLRGEILLEGNLADQAVPLLQPLVDAVRASKPQSLDTTTLRILVAALRAYIATGELAKAGDVESIVVDIGSDSPQVNAVLVEFAKLLGNELSRAESAALEATGGVDPKAKEAAANNVNGTRGIFLKLIDQLAARQQHPLASLIYIADSYAKRGISDKAREQYQRILQAAEADPSILPAGTGTAALTRVRSQLVGLLRTEGKFEEAMKQVEQLIKSNPKDLAPLMEKGRILQGWAETDSKHYDEAIGQWTMLRTTLSRMQRKPPEYYEVIYNAAVCLMAQAKKTQDKGKALQAEQLLKSALVLNPNLSGPDMVTNYNELLKQAATLQGRGSQAGRSGP